CCHSWCSPWLSAPRWDRGRWWTLGHGSGRGGLRLAGENGEKGVQMAHRLLAEGGEVAAVRLGDEPFVVESRGGGDGLRLGAVVNFYALEGGGGIEQGEDANFLLQFGGEGHGGSWL